MSGHIPTTLRHPALGLLVGVTLALTSCSSPSSTAPSEVPPDPSSAASASVSATSTPDTAVTPAPAAVAATLSVQDLGGDWVEYSGEVRGADGAAVCLTELDDMVDAENRAESPMLQRGDRLAFVQTVSWVFPDVATAKAFVDWRLSDAFAQCRQTELAAGPPSDPPGFVVVDAVYPGDGTTPYQGTVGLLLEHEVDGARQLSGWYRHHSYLLGTTVVDVFEQQGGSEGDPADLVERVQKEISAAMDLLIARVPG